MVGSCGRLRATTLGVAALFSLAACVDDDLGSPLEPADPNHASAASAGRNPVKNWDGEMAGLAAKVPGFGGFFEEPGGRMVVWITDPGRGEQARSAVAGFLAARGAKHGPLEARRGTYDFRDLAAWRRALDDAGLKGITLTDVDERLNRVRVGVRDEPAAEGVRGAIARLGIPAAAVVVERVAPAIVEVGLQDRYRPVQGGLQVSTYAAGPCTLGYVVLEDYLGSISYYGNRYVITNSHCTSAFGTDYDDRIGQPDMANQIGTEFSDPPLFTNAVNPDCPPNRSCRRSDAAMFKLDDASTATSRWSAVSRISSGLTLGSPDREYYAGRQYSFWPGMNLTKVGRTTGRTTGSLTSTCTTTPQYDPYGYDTGRTMICQMQGTYNSQGGDSGSPVYYRDPSGNPVIMGIHWGSGGLFSTWLDVWSEIGNDVLARTGVQWTPAFWDDRGNPYSLNP